MVRLWKRNGGGVIAVSLVLEAWAYYRVSRTSTKSSFDTATCIIL